MQERENDFFQPQSRRLLPITYSVGGIQPMVPMAHSAPTHASAWVFSDAASPLQNESLPLPPSLGQGEILVRLTASTLCGSDIHTIDGKRTDPAAPLVLGHEGVGVIDAIGPDGSDSSLRVGDRVTWSVATACGQCSPCVEWGLPQKCVSVKKFGHAPWKSALPAHGLSGTYASHVLLTKGSAVIRVPEAIPDALASPINCALATMVNAVCNSWLLRAHGENGAGVITSGLIQGAGMLGLYGIALLKKGGLAATGGGHGRGGGAPQPPFVAVTDVSPSRLALARRFGADFALDVTGQDDAAVHRQLLEALADHQKKRGASSSGGSSSSGSSLTGQLEGAPSPTPSRGSAGGFDLVVEVCGSSSVLPLGLSCLRPGGEYVFVGQVHPHTPLAGLTGDALIRKCATLRGVHNYSPADLARAVAFLASTVGALPYGELVSPPVPLSQLPAAVALAREGTYARVCVVPD